MAQHRSQASACNAQRKVRPIHSLSAVDNHLFQNPNLPAYVLAACSTKSLLGVLPRTLPLLAVMTCTPMQLQLDLHCPPRLRTTPTYHFNITGKGGHTGIFYCTQGLQSENVTAR
jgi:hypothetical protein